MHQCEAGPVAEIGEMAGRYFQRLAHGRICAALAQHWQDQLVHDAIVEAIARYADAGGAERRTAPRGPRRLYPLPSCKPFREAKLRIDAAPTDSNADQQLVKLIAEAFAVQRLVLASPELSLNQIAKANGRCRKQMAKLLSISWLSPRIIDAITDGVQPSSINRTRLLETALPLAWSAQEALFGIGA